MAGRRWRCAKSMSRSRRVSKYGSAQTSNAPTRSLIRAANRIEFAVGARFGNNDPLIDGARRLLDPLQLTLSRRKARIEQNPDKCNPRHEVAQQAQPFRLHEPRQQRDAGGVAAGPVPALDQADTDRIAAQPEHD